MNKRNAHRSGAASSVTLLILLVAVLLFAGCEGEEVAETGTGFEVKLENDTAWATIDAAVPDDLLRLDDALWHNLVGRRMATTDDNGQAQLRGPQCPALYIYDNSGLVMSPCPAGGGTGACSTGTIVSKCAVSIIDMPADVETVGTWFSVTNMEELETLLVVVAEGMIRVTPATELEYEIVNPELMEYEVITREMGEPIEAQVTSQDEPLFFYTADDQQLAALQAQDNLPPARTWQSLEELPALRVVLSERVENLEPWLAQIWAQAAQDDLQFPPLVPLEEVRTLLDERYSVLLAGNVWEDRRLLEAVSVGAEWNALLSVRATAGRPLNLAWWGNPAEEALVLRDLRETQYQPEFARAILEESGYPNGLPALLAVPAGSAGSEIIQQLVRQLTAAGIMVDLVEASLSEAHELLTRATRDGESPAIWLVAR